MGVSTFVLGAGEKRWPPLVSTRLRNVEFFIQAVSSPNSSVSLRKLQGAQGAGWLNHGKPLFRPYQLCRCKSICWMVEHPQSTVLHHHPRFQARARLATVFKRTFHLINFGSLSSKPTRFCSSAVVWHLHQDLDLAPFHAWHAWHYSAPCGGSQTLCESPCFSVLDQAIFGCISLALSCVAVNTYVFLILCGAALKCLSEVPLKRSGCVFLCSASDSIILRASCTASISCLSSLFQQVLPRKLDVSLGCGNTCVFWQVVSKGV